MANICCISNTFGGSVSGHSLSSWALVNVLTFLGTVGEVYSPLSFPNLYSVDSVHTYVPVVVLLRYTEYLPAVEKDTS